MNEVSDKLRELRERAGLSIRQMAAESGMQPNGYNHYERRFKGTYLPLEKAEAFADALAKGGIDRQEVLALSGSGTAPPKEPHDDALALIPVYDVAASAGPGAYVDDEAVVQRLPLPQTYLRTITSTHPRHLSIINVRGNSMLPTLKDGDVVMLDDSKRHLGFDGMFVLLIEGVLHVKRIGRTGRAGYVVIRSDNEVENPPYEVKIEDVTVIGRVIWSGRKE